MANPFMKRARDEFDHHVKTVANGLMLLSGGGGGGNRHGDNYLTMSGDFCGGRVFECKTCNRQFSSFQALGGHRASHKRPRVMTAAGEPVAVLPPSSPPKPKTHECSICGLEFAIGQALGGHMRRHRAAGNDTVSGGGGDSLALSPPGGGVPVVKKPSSGRRVLCVDLNLTPLENDHLEFIKFGKVA